MKKLLNMFLGLALVLTPLAVAVPAQAASPSWNTAGSYVVAMNYSGIDYLHDMTLVQDGLGNLTGNGGNPAGGTHVYTWVLTSGSVSGNTIDFLANYTATADAVSPQTVMHVLGTIALNGTMIGTWSDNYNGGARSGTWSTTIGNAAALIVPSDIVVTAENFNTNKDANYWGATTGYLLSGTDTAKVASASVALYDASNNLLVTNTSTMASKVNTAKQYSSAFIVKSGTYSTSSTWNFGTWTPNINVIPAKMVVTITDINGFIYTATNSSFQATEPSHPTWASLFTGALVAEDFGVVNYDTGLGMLKGYTAGFGLTDATLAGATSVVVELYSGATLLQTNTAILPKFNADIQGTQFSSPFDVSGTFDYAADGYWTNVRGAEYGQSISATRVVATVTLANGMIVTAENTTVTGDPTTIYPIVVVSPTDKNQCKSGGWKDFTDPTFKNQGQCVSYVQANEHAGKK